VLRIATRGSPLALWQATTVLDKLAANDVAAELLVVQTEGDLDRSSPISALAGRGVFVNGVQAAVLEGAADVAVHSAKDLTSGPTPGLALVGCLARGDVRDALVGSTLAELPRDGLVASGSARRIAQLARLRPDLRFEGLRGNMATRIAVAQRPDVAAVVVAAAALDRLDRSEDITERLDPSVMVPQVGQGAVALEARDDDQVLEALVGLVDDVTTRCVEAERAYLARLGGGCELPVGGLAVADGENLRLTGFLSDRAGTRALAVTMTGEDPAALGEMVASEILDGRGGRDLLAAAR